MYHKNEKISAIQTPAWEDKW